MQSTGDESHGELRYQRRGWHLRRRNVSPEYGYGQSVQTGQRGTNRLVEVEWPLGFRRIRFFLSLLQKLVELALQHFVMALMLVKRFLKGLASPRLFPSHLLDGRADIFNGPGLLVLLITDYRFEFGIDLQRRLAARAADFQELTFAFGHTADSSVTVPCQRNY